VVSCPANKGWGRASGPGRGRWAAKKTLGRGPVKVVTKDGLVRVVDAEGHAGSFAQGRLGFLCAAKGAEVVAERLSSLIRDTEREEAARGIPSLQLWTGLVKIFQVYGVSGSALLVAPSCAPGANPAMGSCGRSATATR
jgi:hypothetical protein